MEHLGIEERLAAIESRLVAIENRFRPSVLPVNIPKPQSQPVPRTPAPSIHHQDEEVKPGNWLGIIAIICFVLAAGFIIKLSIDSGWLTPIRQLGIAILFGLSLIAGGLKLMSRDREYASLLPGAGIIVLYLTVFAAHSPIYYELIPFGLAMAMISLISGICIWLYTEIEHDVYPITAAIGTYIAPAILGINSSAIFSIYYFLFASFVFSAISVRVESRLLTMVSAYLAILMTAFIGLDLHQDGLLASVLALHFLIFSTGTYLYARENSTTLTENEAWGFLPVLLIFYAVEYYFISRVYPDLAPWISLGFAGVLIGLYLAAKNRFTAGPGSQSLVVAFATLVCFHSIYLEILPADARPWLFVLIMLGFAFLPAKFSSQKQFTIFHLPIFALGAIVAIEYLTMLSHLWDSDGGYWLVVSFVAFASIWTALLVAENKFIECAEYGCVLLGAAHVLAVMAFYRLTHDIGSLAVSASWLFYAICVIGFAFLRKDEVMAKSALFVLAFAAGKALLYDAASAPTIVRILCLLLTGVALYGSGFFMRKITGWTNISGSNS